MIIEEQGEICPYMDPVLKRNYRSYLSFLRNLRSRGLLRFTRHPEEMVAVFFVAKKDGSLRMVIDARRTNRRFISPRAVDLCTSETFARIEVEAPVCESSKDAQSLAEQISMWVGLADISDCFHRLGISEDLSKFFRLEPVRASDFNISVCEGELLVESDLV